MFEISKSHFLSFYQSYGINSPQHDQIVQAAKFPPRGDLNSRHVAGNHHSAAIHVQGTKMRDRNVVSFVFASVIWITIFDTVVCSPSLAFRSAELCFGCLRFNDKAPHPNQT